MRECTLRVIPSKATVEHLKPRAVKSIASNGSRYSAGLIRDEVDTMLAVSGRHPNLPTVYDVYEKRHKGVAPGTTVHVVNIVTEQYAGGDLLEGIAGGSGSPFQISKPSRCNSSARRLFAQRRRRSPRHKAR